MLDEPTNDLDIPTLEILEESLLEYPGALVLVTHDRYMLDRVSTVVLGLDGSGRMERFADYWQWDAWQRSAPSREALAQSATPPPREIVAESSGAPAKRKLSYNEGRELAGMEQCIAEAERDLHAKQDALADPAIAVDHLSVQNTSRQIAEAQKLVERLYERWAELEAKNA